MKRFLPKGLGNFIIATEHIILCSVKIMNGQCWRFSKGNYIANILLGRLDLIAIHIQVGYTWIYTNIHWCHLVRVLCKSKGKTVFLDNSRSDVLQKIQGLGHERKTLPLDLPM